MLPFLQFHRDCIDPWLLHTRPTCPIDGLVVWDRITAQLDEEENTNNRNRWVHRVKISPSPGGHLILYRHIQDFIFTIIYSYHVSYTWPSCPSWLLKFLNRIKVSKGDCYMSWCCIKQEWLLVCNMIITLSGQRNDKVVQTHQCSPVVLELFI